MLKGSALHKVNETLYKDKKAGQTPLTSKQVSDLTIYLFDACLEEAVTKEELTKVAEKDKDVLYGDVLSVSVDYAEHIVPHIIPLETEVEFIYQARCGVDILMYIDLIKQMFEDEPLSRSIVDYKVTAKKWSISQLLGDLQFVLYTQALSIPNVEIHNLIKGPKRSTFNSKYTPKYTGELDLSKNIKCLQTSYLQSEYNHLENIIESAAQQISAGIFPPADPSSWVCTEKWCGYWRECRGQS